MNEKMGLLGRKLGMTQLYDEDGRVIPVTIIDVSSNVVVRVKHATDKDGYNALQLGIGTAKAKKLNKADNGRLAKSGLETLPATVREIRVNADEANKREAGQAINATDVFKTGSRVDISGLSKGRGFAGVMKRHNFAGFERSHGVHEYFRHGGSIGTRLTPGHVIKGKRMGGQMGNEKVTVQNVEIARIDEARNLVFLRGGVPGAIGALVTVRHTTKG